MRPSALSDRSKCPGAHAHRKSTNSVKTGTIAVPGGTRSPRSAERRAAIRDSVLTLPVLKQHQGSTVSTGLFNLSPVQITARFHSPYGTDETSSPVSGSKNNRSVPLSVFNAALNTRNDEFRRRKVARSGT